MKTRAKLFLALSGLGIIIVGNALTYTSAFGKLCENFGGRWGSEHGECITRSCFNSGSCGYWSNPNAHCIQLKVGDSLSEVYFQLGNPDRVEGKWYIWLERKGYPVSAEIENEKLKRLKCSN